MIIVLHMQWYVKCFFNIWKEFYHLTFQALDDARDYVNKANDTLNLAVNKTLPYNISQYVSKQYDLVLTVIVYTCNVGIGYSSCIKLISK